MRGMNGNKSSCLQLTTAQTRIAKSIRLRKGGWMCLAGIPDNAPGMWSTCWVLGRFPSGEGTNKNENHFIIPVKFCLRIFMCFSLIKEPGYQINIVKKI